MARFRATHTCAKDALIPNVPFVPTSMETARRMLEIARVGSEDVVYDLGCGDGRILIIAVEEFGAKGAVGYEVVKETYNIALRNISRRGLLGKITLIEGDLFDADLSGATVITLYLDESTNQRLKPKLEREAKDGTRIVSYAYKIRGWKAARKIRLRGRPRGHQPSTR